MSSPVCEGPALSRSPRPVSLPRVLRLPESAQTQPPPYPSRGTGGEVTSDSVHDGSSGERARGARCPASLSLRRVRTRARSGSCGQGPAQIPAREASPTDFGERLCCAHVPSFSFSRAAAGLLAANARSARRGVRGVESWRRPAIAKAGGWKAPS